jgi:uncharacterized protein (DUF924 family)
MSEDYERVLSRWIGPLDAQGRAAPEQAKRWYTKDPEFDALLREEFGAEHQAVLAGEREHWRETPRGRLAYIVLLDQLSRNIFRGTAEMYAGDDRALETARQALEAGDDKRLAFDERCFLYMPFMHSEALADQERCVALFTALAEEVDPALRPSAEYSLDYAVRHRDIVARFGRFPHRNGILGRDSTKEEIAFLKEPGSSF